MNKCRLSSFYIAVKKKKKTQSNVEKKYFLHVPHEILGTFEVALNVPKVYL